MKTPRDLAAEIGRKEPFELPELELFLNLIRTAEQLSGEINRLLGGYGLSRPQYNVLRILESEPPEGVPIRAVGRRMITRAPDLTRLLDRLEAAGLTARSREGRDRREVIVRLQPEGLKRLRDAKAPVEVFLRQRFIHLSPEDIVLLNRLVFQARWADPGGAVKAGKKGECS
ncbi:MAG: MarR family transcriptional regulator [Acidobacteria bacterium]|nr:MarR family transcriptional regulator [Acidobacteriota bacterium]